MFRLPNVIRLRPVQKKFDQAYFDRWYRGRARIGAAPDVRRKAAMAVSVAEYFLRRTIRNALDIGCGEAPWLKHLRELRPKVRYAGYDPSDYVVNAFGDSHNIRRGSFGELAALNIRERFDLVICSDVLHYLSDDEIRRGLPQLARLMRGAAFIEVLAREDEVFGDTAGMFRRPAEWYERVFASAKLVKVAPFLWVIEKIADDSAALER